MSSPSARRRHGSSRGSDKASAHSSPLSLSPGTSNVWPASVSSQGSCHQLWLPRQSPVLGIQRSPQEGESLLGPSNRLIAKGRAEQARRSCVLGRTPGAERPQLSLATGVRGRQWSAGEEKTGTGLQRVNQGEERRAFGWPGRARRGKDKDTIAARARSCFSHVPWRS